MILFSFTSSSGTLGDAMGDETGNAPMSRGGNSTSAGAGASSSGA